MEIFQSSDTWYIISFLVFLVVAWKVGKSAFLSMLDTRIETIKKDIETAESLRIEAQELLAQYQRKYRDCLKEAEAIIDEAKENAEALKTKSQEEIEEQIKRAEEHHKQRLDLMKQEAIQEIRTHAAMLALEGTRKMISEELDEDTRSRFFEQSIQNIDKSLN